MSDMRQIAERCHEMDAVLVGYRHPLPASHGQSLVRAAQWLQVCDTWLGITVNFARGAL